MAKEKMTFLSIVQRPDFREAAKQSTVLGHVARSLFLLGWPHQVDNIGVSGEHFGEGRVPQFSEGTFVIETHGFRIDARVPGAWVRVQASSIVETRPMVRVRMNCSSSGDMGAEEASHRLKPMLTIAQHLVQIERLLGDLWPKGQRTNKPESAAADAHARFIVIGQRARDEYIKAGGK